MKKLITLIFSFLFILNSSNVSLEAKGFISLRRSKVNYYISLVRCLNNINYGKDIKIPNAIKLILDEYVAYYGASLEILNYYDFLFNSIEDIYLDPKEFIDLILKETNEKVRNDFYISLEPLIMGRGIGRLKKQDSFNELVLDLNIKANKSIQELLNDYLNSKTIVSYKWHSQGFVKDFINFVYNSISRSNNDFAMKKLSLDKAPEKLILSLNRFLFDKEHSLISKDTKSLFISENIVLGQLEYLFSGMILHAGVTPDNGRYISILKQGDEFVVYNSNKIIAKYNSLDHALKDYDRYNPYVLFYKKIEKKELLLVAHDARLSENSIEIQSTNTYFNDLNLESSIELLLLDESKTINDLKAYGIEKIKDLKLFLIDPTFRLPGINENIVLKALYKVIHLFDNNMMGSEGSAYF